MDDFGIDKPPTPEQLKAQKQLRDRAKKYLQRFRSELPRMTPKQSALIVKMLLAAYAAGEEEMEQEWGWRETAARQEEYEKRAAASQRGVDARREKSKRWAVRAEFEAARKAGKSVSVKHLANKHGTSLATAYRAVDDLLKQPKG